MLSRLVGDRRVPVLADGVGVVCRADIPITLRDSRSSRGGVVGVCGIVVGVVGRCFGIVVVLNQKGENGLKLVVGIDAGCCV